MTVEELIYKLLDIIRDNPNKRDVEVFVYITNIEELVDNGESPQPIQLIDGAISDRVDINI